METIMKRNSEGIVKIDGTSVQIPQDELALSVLANNKLFANSKFSKDGWIYVDGKPVSKWFKQCYSDGTSVAVRIWEPILQDLPKLEARYIEVSRRCEDFLTNRYVPVSNKLLEVGTAHVRPTHRHESPQKWWLYKVKECNDTKYISFDWVDAPKEIFNFGIGQDYYRAEKKLGRYYGYKHRFRSVLGVAIDNYLRKHHKAVEANTVMHLLINGRGYWYTACANRYGVIVWEKIVWAEKNNIIEMSL